MSEKIVRPPLDRKLLLLCGPPGAGKSHYAKIIGATGYIILDPEEILDTLQAHARRYYPESWRVAKAMTWSGFLACLSSGANVIVTIAGVTKSERDAWRQKALAANYDVKTMILMPSPEVCLQRCKSDKRRPKTTRWKSIIDNWFKYYEPD